MSFLFNNRGNSNLALPISDSDTELRIPWEDFNFFTRSNAEAGDVMYAILRGPEDREIIAIDLVNNYSGFADKYLKVTRGQGGSQAGAWPAGTLIFLSTHADHYEACFQPDETRQIDFNPNGVLSPLYQGEKVFQYTGCEIRWWMSFDAVNPYWHLIAGDPCINETFADPGWGFKVWYDTNPLPEGWSFEDALQIGSYTDIHRAGYDSINDWLFIPVGRTYKQFFLDTDNSTTGANFSGTILKFSYDEANSITVLVEGGTRVHNGGGGGWTLRKTFTGGVIYALGYDPVNFTSVIAFRETSGAVAIWVSTDGGVTWSEEDTLGGVPNPNLPTEFAFDTTNNVLYLATRTQIYKSSDGGYSWSHVKDLATDYGIFPVDDICYNSKNDTLVLSLGYDSTPTTTDNLFISADGGNNWTGQQILTPHGNQESSKVAHNEHEDRLYMFLSLSGSAYVYGSEDGGATWLLEETFSGGSANRRASTMIYIPDYTVTYLAYSDDLYLHTSQAWKSYK